MSFKPTRCPSWPLAYPLVLKALKPILPPVTPTRPILGPQTKYEGRSVATQALKGSTRRPQSTPPRCNLQLRDLPHQARTASTPVNARLASRVDHNEG